MTVDDGDTMEDPAAAVATRVEGSVADRVDVDRATDPRVLHVCELRTRTAMPGWGVSRPTRRSSPSDW